MSEEKCYYSLDKVFNNEKMFYLIQTARIKLSYNEVECIVAFLKNFDKEMLPETLRDDILPRLEGFLIENY